MAQINTRGLNLETKVAQGHSTKKGKKKNDGTNECLIGMHNYTAGNWKQPTDLLSGQLKNKIKQRPPPDLVRSSPAQGAAGALVVGERRHRMLY